MPTYQPTDWYDAPLYYDVIFDADTAHEVDFLQALSERYVGGGSGRILEPACGTGRLVGELARRGFAVSGFDASLPMLAFAKQRLMEAGVTADLRQGRLEHFTCHRRFDLAHCLVNTFRYLLSEGEARDHLRCMAEALGPGGVYVLGLHLTDYHERRPTRERWIGQRDGVHVTCKIQDWPADARRRLQRVRSRLLVEREGTTRRYETRWAFRTYGPRQLKRLLASVPALELIGSFNFHHDLNQPVSLGDGDLDKVLVLRRRPGAG